jgi:hypothetical protein
MPRLQSIKVAAALIERRKHQGMTGQDRAVIFY